MLTCKLYSDLRHDSICGLPLDNRGSCNKVWSATISEIKMSFWALNRLNVMATGNKISFSCTNVSFDVVSEGRPVKSSLNEVLDGSVYTSSYPPLSVQH